MLNIYLAQLFVVQDCFEVMTSAIHKSGLDISLHALTNLSDIDYDISDDSYVVCAIGEEWHKSISSLHAILTGLDTTKIVFLIQPNNIELARRLGACGCEYIKVMPSNHINPSEWLDTLTELHHIIIKTPSLAILNKPERKAVIFSDPKSKSMLALLERVAKTEVTTLLTGESGVGKEVVARILHTMSRRARKPFVAINCAAIPENLVESMFFGHVKGSFTGAIKDQAGIFEQANGGIVFLDEIGELPIHIQPKLLRLLQERKAVRVGGLNEVSFDIRLIAATNQDLPKLVKEKLFREDLFYRINAFNVRIPSLRERSEDIAHISKYYANSSLCGGFKCDISMDAITKLSNYHWPGNVRELENVIARAKVLAFDGAIDQQHIVFDSVSFLDQDNFNPSAAHTATFNDFNPSNLSSAKEEAEMQSIFQAIETTNTREEAASLLGISPRTLRHKLQKYKESNTNYGHESLGVMNS